LKWADSLDTEALEAPSKETLAQIEDKRYPSEMSLDRIKKVLKLGVAFSGKKVKIKKRRN